MRLSGQPSKPGFGIGSDVAIVKPAFTMGATESHVKGSIDMTGTAARPIEGCGQAWKACLRGVLARAPGAAGQCRGISSIILCNKTRQGYALRSTLKQAGYFFVEGG